MKYLENVPKDTIVKISRVKNIYIYMYIIYRYNKYAYNMCVCIIFECEVNRHIQLKLYAASYMSIFNYSVNKT